MIKAAALVLSALLITGCEPIPYGSRVQVWNDDIRIDGKLQSFTTNSVTVKMDDGSYYRINGNYVCLKPPKQEPHAEAAP
jgi:hypothetical protein